MRVVTEILIANGKITSEQQRWTDMYYAKLEAANAAG
jgi:hypothetical protein